jgi:hypothetical protein
MLNSLGIFQSKIADAFKAGTFGNFRIDIHPYERVFAFAVVAAEENNVWVAVVSCHWAAGGFAGSAVVSSYLVI